MDESEYRRLHEKEVNELRLSRMGDVGYNSDRYIGIFNKPLKVDYSTKNELIFAGLLVSLIGFVVSSSFILFGYYIGRNNAREEVINEIERMQKEEKMSKDLGEIIERERVKYFIKEPSSKK